MINQLKKENRELRKGKRKIAEGIEIMKLRPNCRMNHWRIYEKSTKMVGKTQEAKVELGEIIKQQRQQLVERKENEALVMQRHRRQEEISSNFWFKGEHTTT